VLKGTTIVDESPVRASRHGTIAVVAFNRPAQRNAMLPHAMEALRDALERAGADDAVRAVVLAAEGPAFCVGADVKWLASSNDPQAAVRELVTAHHAAILALRALPKPVVAAVNGAAAGGGVSFVLAADYRCAAATASLTPAYLRLGLTPDGGNSAFLVRFVGIGRAMELLLNNRTLGAEEALGWGLVEEVVAPEQLWEQAILIAARLGELPGPAVSATRELLDQASGQSIVRQLEVERETIITAAGTASFREGLAAFVEKRPPRFHST
jgi:2-(1,2-epoxy-1,2-dihydrophenyl)acetyl-CoA isomerase